MLKQNISNSLSILIIIVCILVLFSIVPNSFSISLIGFGFCLILLALKQPTNLIDKIFNKLSHRNLSLLFFSWIVLIIVAGCLNAWARFVSPGYDLYWFTQAVSQAKLTGILKTTSERFYNTILMQHWEPILYTVIPFAFFVKNSMVTMLWQGLGFLFGSIGAYKLSQFLFSDTKYPNAKYFTTALYILSFSTINPLSFDIHPPVFGGLLFIPWIIYSIILKKNKLLPIFLLLLLSMCGEIFFAIITTYFAYLIVEKKHSFLNIVFSIITIVSGYLILAFYQKYIGPWWSGQPFYYADRYKNIGGDSFGILLNTIHHPIYVFSQLFEKEKIKTFLKIFLYNGPFFIFALKSEKYRRLAFFILLGCIPYFIQIGLTSYSSFYSTNTHYISAIGSQWWAVTTLGIYSFLTENMFIKLKNIILKNSIISFSLLFYFLNSSEWRKSPLYPLRAIFEREIPAQNVRNYLTNIEKKKGILFINTEWLCPISAFERQWLVCGAPYGYFDKMQLNVVVARENSIEEFYNGLSTKAKESQNGLKLKQLINLVHNKQEKNEWSLKITSHQTPHKETPISYSIYEIDNSEK
jgi:uncharacterized membrane protein